MTEIERKALALVNEVREGRPYTIEEAKREYGWCFQAVCRAIEQREAFRQEVSDAVEAYVTGGGLSGWDEWERLKRLILPKPDPLVEAVRDACFAQGLATKHTPGELTEHLRAALAARGLKIVEDK